jgi:hypothetical protein
MAPATAGAFLLADVPGMQQKFPAVSDRRCIALHRLDRGQVSS